MGKHNERDARAAESDHVPRHDKAHGKIGAPDLVEIARLDRLIRQGAVRIVPRETQR